MLPLFAELEDQYASAVLIANRQHRQDVVIEYILLSARLQIVVEVRVFNFEVVIMLDELERRLGIILAWPQKPNQPRLVVKRAFEIRLRCWFTRKILNSGENSKDFKMHFFDSSSSKIS